jgi:hypothetical protein
MFRLLGMHPGPDITVPAAASLAGLQRSQAYLALVELCDQHLVTEHAPGRYLCHVLLRAYAAEAARTRDSDADRRAAVQRLLDHYLHTANTASAALYPRYIQLTGGQPVPGVLPEQIAGARQAAQWFEDERHVLLAVIDRAASESHAPHAWTLPHAVGMFFRNEVHRRKLTAAQETALAIAGELGDLAGQVMAHYHLGVLRLGLGDYDRARHHLDEAIELGQEADHTTSS